MGRGSCEDAPIYNRAKPEKRVLEECIIVDEGSGCTSKQDNLIVDESSSDDESDEDFYCSESDWDLLLFVDIV